MPYFKRLENDIITSANEIVGPGWVLDGSDTTATHDGWRWFDTPEQAYLHFGKSDADAEAYQVRVWMVRNGMDPDTVPGIIAAVTQDGPERQEALMRWEYAVRIPRNFPLVDAIGALMTPPLTPEAIDAAWPEICSI